MKETNIYNMFLSMDMSTNNADHYSVLSIPDLKHKIGKSEEGWAKFFIRTEPGKSAIRNIKGEILWVEYNVDCCLVDEENNTSNARFAIATLRSDDESLQHIFLEVFTLSLLTMPQIPNDTDLSIKIEALLSIFSALRKAPVHKIQGLWAELLVMDRSKDIDTLVRAWHNSPSAKYDFTRGEDKIEVKSTSSEDRVHHFSLDQLNPNQSSNLLIASIIVRESAQDENGLSVMDLYEKICKRISSVDDRIHLYSAIINTLGNEYDKALNVYFDYSQAKDSLEFYDYKDVPRPLKEHIPVLVTGVSFNSNLSGLTCKIKSGTSYPADSLFNCI